jgi:hypothetical protein
MWNLLLKLN